MNVRYLIQRAVKEHSSKLALVYTDTRRTFHKLNIRVNSLANGLLQIGIKKCDRVGMLIKNCSEFIEIDFALSKTGDCPGSLKCPTNGSRPSIRESLEYIREVAQGDGNLVDLVLESVRAYASIGKI